MSTARFSGWGGSAQHPVDKTRPSLEADSL